MLGSLHCQSTLQPDLQIPCTDAVLRALLGKTQCTRAELCTQPEADRPSTPVCEEYPDAQSDCLAQSKGGRAGGSNVSMCA